MIFIVCVEYEFRLYIWCSNEIRNGILLVVVWVIMVFVFWYRKCKYFVVSFFVSKVLFCSRKIKVGMIFILVII